ncbi:uncharacterized protein TNCV_852301 [Trichonephila clavipes]|nr:uncharacterized protein TNCV_852301 [Trichonephila clavipes]
MKRQENKVWVFEDDPTPTIVKRQRTMKKICMPFSLEVQKWSVIKLEGQKIVTATWYTTKCFREILQEVNVRGLMLHHDNASFHTVGLTVEFLKQKQIKVIEHPPNSPHLVVCDFCLFFNLNGTYY